MYPLPACRLVIVACADPMGARAVAIHDGNSPVVPFLCLVLKRCTLCLQSPRALRPRTRSSPGARQGSAERSQTRCECPVISVRTVGVYTYIHANRGGDESAALFAACVRTCMTYMHACAVPSLDITRYHIHTLAYVLVDYDILVRTYRVCRFRRSPGGLGAGPVIYPP